MATLGELVISIKTSGVEEARKQLEALDKLATSIGEKQIRAKVSASSAATSGIDKNEMDAYKKKFEERLSMAQNFYQRDLNAHATNLSKMVENEGAAWAKIKKIRERSIGVGGVPSGGGGGSSVPSREPTGDSGPIPNAGSSSRDSAGFFSRVVGSAMKIGTVNLIAAAAASAAEGATIGTIQGYARAFESVPILGQGFAAGRTIGKFATGQLQEEADQPHIERAREQNLRAKSFTQTAQQTQVEQAQIEFSAAGKRLELASKNGEISDANYEKAIQSEMKLADAKVKNAKFERSIQLETSANVTQAMREQSSALATRLVGGDVAGQIASLISQKDAQQAILKVESERAANAGDGKITKDLNNQRILIDSIYEKNVQLLKVDQERAVANINNRTAAISSFSASVGAGTSEEEVKKAHFAKEYADALSEVARIKALPQDDKTMAELKESEAVAKSILAVESRRVSVMELQANLRIKAGMAIVNEISLISRHQSVAAADARDEQDQAQKIAELTLKGGPHVDEQIQNERDITQARKNLRQKELNEHKGFMDAETSIIEKTNTGAVTHLQGHLMEIREKARQQAILNPEIADQIQKRESADEMKAIRENMSLKSVGTMEANLTAFQGRAGRIIKRDMPQGDEGQPMNYKIGNPNTIKEKNEEKQLSYLEQIVNNTRGEKIARYG